MRILTVDLRAPSRRAARALAAGVLCVAWCGAAAQSWAYDDGTVPYVVTPHEVVHRMLRIAEVGPGDMLIDLGSGDGRIVIAAARRGARALGVDIDAALVERARRNAERAGVADRARFEAKDLFKLDLAPASVVTMYLLPEVNRALRPRLLGLTPGTRVVSHDWDMGDWVADETLTMRTPEKPVGGRDGLSHVRLWIVPDNARGRWSGRIEGYGGDWTLRIEQKYQLLEVEAQALGREVAVRSSRLRGRELKLALTGVLERRAANVFLTGTIDGDRIEGDARIYDGVDERTLKWKATRSK